MEIKDLSIGNKFQTKGGKDSIYTVLSGIRNIDNVEGILCLVQQSNGDIYDVELSPYIKIFSYLFNIISLSFLFIFLLPPKYLLLT